MMLLPLLGKDVTPIAAAMCDFYHTSCRDAKLDDGYRQDDPRFRGF